MQKEKRNHNHSTSPSFYRKETLFIFVVVAIGIVLAITSVTITSNQTSNLPYGNCYTNGSTTCINSYYYQCLWSPNLSRLAWQYQQCNGVCQNNICIPTQVPTCTDSDGRDYYKKGTVTASNKDSNWNAFTVEDVCDLKFDPSGNILAESVCEQRTDGYYYPLQIHYYCSYGCSQGACLLTPIVTVTNVTTTNITEETVVVVNITNITREKVIVQNVSEVNQTFANITTNITVNITTRDTIPPIISCPTNQTVTSSPFTATSTASDANGVTVSVGTTTASIAANTWGASLPLVTGANPFTAVATDNAGNTQQCSFTITLQPPAQQISETVKCIFKNSLATQKCYSEKESCQGSGTCIATVTGFQGETRTWKSLPCTGTFTTNVDGSGDAITFDCAPVCGNNIVEGTEVCDGTALAGQTCASKLGTGYTGTLKCGTNCQFDTSGCVAPPPADTTPPTCQLQTGTMQTGGIIISAASMMLSGTTTDNVETTSVSCNNVPATLTGVMPKSFATTVSLTEGINMVSCTARDAAGNTGTCTQTITKDTTPPTITCQSSQKVTSSPFAATGSTSDTNGIKSVMIGTTTATVAANTWSTTLPLAEGQNQFTATAMDNAGNTQQCSFTITMQAPPAVLEGKNFAEASNIITTKCALAAERPNSNIFSCPKSAVAEPARAFCVEQDAGNEPNTHGQLLFFQPQVATADTFNVFIENDFCLSTTVLNEKACKTDGTVDNIRHDCQCSEGKCTGVLPHPPPADTTSPTENISFNITERINISRNATNITARIEEVQANVIVRIFNWLFGWL